LATIPELNDEIDAQLPTNAVGQITASKLRTVLHDMTNSLSSLGGSTIAGGGLGFTFDSRAAVISTTIPTIGAGGPNWISTNGYASAGDGGGWLYVRTSGTPNYSNLIWFSSADGQKWVPVIKNDPLKLEMAGGGVGATASANSAAADAIHSIFYTNKSGFPAGYAYAGPCIQLGLGQYNFSGPWFIKGGSNIRGLGTGSAGARPTVLKFPAGSDGLVLGCPSSNGRLYNPGLYGTDYDARGTVIRDLAIEGGWLLNGATPYSQNNSTGQRGIGILSKATCQLENLYISGFAEFGVYIKGSAGAGGSATEPTPGTADNTDSSESYVCANGYANTWMMSRVYVETIGCDGFRVRGADSNAGTYIECSADLCYAWGYNDLSFLGNFFWACHSATNGFRWAEQSRLDTNTGKMPGAYQCSDDSNASNIVACYSEGGQPGSVFRGFAVVMGGLHAAGSPNQTPFGVRFANQGGGVMNMSPTYFNSAYGDGARGVTMSPGDISNCLMKFETSAETIWNTAEFNRFQFGTFSKKNLLVMTMSGYTPTMGRASAVGGGNLFFPYGYWVAGPQVNADFHMRFRGIYDGFPTAGQFAQGDHIDMLNPSAGGVWGYVCTTAGDYAATPPVWKSKGNLAA
jgi:hypothetical protein